MQSGQTLPSKPAKRELLDKMLSEGILGVLPIQSSEYFQNHCLSAFSGTADVPLSEWAEWIIHSCVYGGHIGEAHRVAYSGIVFQLSTCTQIYMELKSDYYRALAARDDCQDIVEKEIEQHPKDGFKMLAAAIEMGNEKIVTFLLRTRPDLAKARMPQFSVLQWAQTLRMKALLLCLTDEILNHDVDRLKEEKKELLAAIKSLPPEIGNKGLMAKRREGSAVRRVVYAARTVWPVTDNSEMPQAFEKEITERRLENIFDKMCQWARAGKLAELQELKREQPTNFAHQLNVVVRDLAIEGDAGAVFFLIKEFQASFHWAVDGFARAGRVALVNDLFRSYTFKSDQFLGLCKTAVDGFSEGGHLRGGYAKILRLLALVDNNTLLAQLGLKMKEIDSHPAFWIASVEVAADLRRLKTQEGILDKYRKIYQPILKEFLQSGGDPNTKINCFSLLQCAAVENDEESVKLLLEYGADPGSDRLSAYDVAASTKIQALMLCLSSNISPNDVEKLKYDRDTLFEEIKTLPKEIKEIADKGLLDIYNKESPIHQVMSERFDWLSASKMVKKFNTEVEARGLKPEQKVERKAKPELSPIEREVARRFASEARAEDETVKNVCKLAISKDGKTITSMVLASGVDASEKIQDAIVILARDKQIEAVTFLIDLLNGLLSLSRPRLTLIDDAIYGYALGGDVDKVNDFLEIGASKDWAVCGYAQRGFVNEVNVLIKDGASRDLAVRGFEIGGHLSGERSIIQFMSLIEDIELRRLIAEKAKEKNSRLNVDVLMREAASPQLVTPPVEDIVALLEKQQDEIQVLQEKILTDLKVANESLATITAVQEVDIPERKDERPQPETTSTEAMPTSLSQVALMRFQHQGKNLDAESASRLHPSPAIEETSSQPTSPQLVAPVEPKQPLEEEQQSKETIVEKICRLARLEDSEALAEMIRQERNGLVFREGGLALILLAQGKETRAVNFLLSEFRAKNEEGHFAHFAVQGYAQGGHDDEVWSLLHFRACREFAVMGYAIGGFVERVNAFLDQDVGIGEALEGYARSGNVREVNALIKKGASKDVKDYAVWGFEKAGRLSENSESIVQLLSSIDDIELRRLIAEKATQKNNTLDVDTLMREAAAAIMLSRQLQPKKTVVTRFSRRESIIQLMLLTDDVIFCRLLTQRTKEKKELAEVLQVMILKLEATKTFHEKILTGIKVANERLAAIVQDASRLLPAPAIAETSSQPTSPQLIEPPVEEKEQRVALMRSLHQGKNLDAESASRLPPSPATEETSTSPQLVEPPRKKAEIEAICRFAKAKNKEALEDIFYNGECLDVLQGKALILLAEQGDVESVNFLIEHFGFPLPYAVFGYAKGGYDQCVDDLLEKGASIVWAIEGYAVSKNEVKVKELQSRFSLAKKTELTGWAMAGYARGGHDDFVKREVKTDEDKDFILSGYALAGKDQKVAEIDPGSDQRFRRAIIQGYALGGHRARLTKYLVTDEDLNTAVMYYAVGFHVNAVNDLIARGAKRRSAVKGFGKVHFYTFSYKTILLLLALIEDETLRVALANKASKKNKQYKDKAEKLLKEAEKFKKIITLRQFEKDLAKKLSLDVDPCLPVTRWFALFHCLVMTRDEENVIRMLQQSGASFSEEFLHVAYEHAPHLSRIAALILCLTRNISARDVTELKEYKEKLFKDICQLPPDIANKGLLAILDPTSPVRKVMYASRGWVESDDNSHMPTVFREEIERRGLKPKAAETQPPQPPLRTKTISLPKY